MGAGGNHPLSGGGKIRNMKNARVNARVFRGGGMTGGFEGPFMNFFSFLFSLVGSLLIIYGGLRATAELILFEVFKKPYKYQQIRKELTNRIVFGLEFFIAADVLQTVLDPSRDELLLLGTVVLIRTVLGYFLSKEVTEYQLD